MGSFQKNNYSPNSQTELHALPFLRAPCHRFWPFLRILLNSSIWTSSLAGNLLPKFKATAWSSSKASQGQDIYYSSMSKCLSLKTSVFRLQMNWAGQEWAKEAIQYSHSNKHWELRIHSPIPPLLFCLFFRGPLVSARNKSIFCKNTADFFPRLCPINRGKYVWL